MTAARFDKFVRWLPNRVMKANVDAQDMEVVAGVGPNVIYFQIPNEDGTHKLVIFDKRELARELKNMNREVGRGLRGSRKV